MEATRRTAALPSMAATASLPACMTTIRSSSPTVMPLPWATTSSPVPPLARRARWSTPLATVGVRTARCASSCTTRRCPSRPLALPPSPRRRSLQSRTPGPAPSRTSPRSTWMAATTSLPPPRLLASCTPTATPTCCSSPPRLLSTSSAPPLRRPCPTSWVARLLMEAMRRMVALPSTAAMASLPACMTTIRSSSPMVRPLPWATMSSPAPRLGRRARWSTPLATGGARTARCASSCTTHRCPSSRLALPP
mmetsp:Transcript_26404/g.74314  ORF Transcript_26404/g.74314 Transcript_26404/m.74314 type:complete len:251 (+) Transcript_26404:41-793(+)